MQNLAVAAQAVVESVGPRSFLNPSRQEACTVDLVASVCVCRADEGGSIQSYQSYQPKDHSWCTVRVDSQFHFHLHSTKCQSGCAGEWKRWKVYRVRVLFNEALLMRRPFLFVLYLGMPWQRTGKEEEKSAALTDIVKDDSESLFVEDWGGVCSHRDWLRDMGSSPPPPDAAERPEPGYLLELA
jgi:hypothetical protein